MAPYLIILYLDKKFGKAAVYLTSSILLEPLHITYEAYLLNTGNLHFSYSQRQTRQSSDLVYSTIIRRRDNYILVSF